VEQDHDGLLASGGAYAALYDAQFALLPSTNPHRLFDTLSLLYGSNAGRFTSHCVPASRTESPAL
jgi:hypothetical protein